MDVRIKCPHCSTVYRIPEAFLPPGGKCKCKRCHQSFKIARDEESDAVVPPPIVDRGARQDHAESEHRSTAVKECPYCAETINAKAKKCRFCGEFFSENQPQPNQAEGPSPGHRKLALIACPECKKKISDTAGNCPNCGHQLTPEKVAELKKQQQVANGCAIGCLSVIAVFVILILWLISGPAGTSNAELAKERRQEADAYKPISEREGRQINAFRKGCRNFREAGESKESAIREIMPNVSVLTRECREAIASEVWGE